jgi:2-aminoethylphosphonate-pyruvate transaminase
VTAGTFYLDLYAHYCGQEIERSPLFTPAMQILYAFDVALDLTLEEGVRMRAARYAARASEIRAGLEDQEFTLLLAPEHRSNSVTDAFLPDGVSYQELHDGLKALGFVIYAAPAEYGALVRVANMGQLTAGNVSDFLNAVATVLDEIRARG